MIGSQEWFDLSKLVLEKLRPLTLLLPLPFTPSLSFELDSPQDAMTEEQRMEEGRRMFQIFAARMFEQRVLQAYREKVSFL